MEQSTIEQNKFEEEIANASSQMQIQEKLEQQLNVPHQDAKKNLQNMPGIILEKTFSFLTFIEIETLKILSKSLRLKIISVLFNKALFILKTQKLKRNELQRSQQQVQQYLQQQGLEQQLIEKRNQVQFIVQQIKPFDVQEMKVFYHPPQKCLDIVEIVCIMLSLKPLNIRGNEYSYMPIMLSDFLFLKKLDKLDISKLDSSQIKQIEKFLSNPEYNLQSFERINRALAFF